MNKCIFIGNLTRDPEIKYTATNKAVCNVGLAINRKTSKGDEATFIDLVAWEKTAELMDKYLKKGSKVSVVCRVRTESWDDRETGNRRSKQVFDVEEVQFLDKKSEDSNGSDDNGGYEKPANNRKQSRPASKQEPDYDDGGGMVDDIPF